MTATADIILLNGRIATNDRSNPEAQAVAISGERILALGRNEDMLPLAVATTRQIDLAGRRVIPGLIDSHMHFI